MVLECKPCQNGMKVQITAVLERKIDTSCVATFPQLYLYYRTPKLSYFLLGNFPIGNQDLLLLVASKYLHQRESNSEC